MPSQQVFTKSFDELSVHELYQIAKLRTDVFFVEQRVDETELDGRDLEEKTEHWWLATEDAPVAAYLRVLWDASPEHRDANRVIGRVVTRADQRGRGLALQLVRAAVAAHPGEAYLLHAQEYVQSLYAKVGFEVYTEPYLEAGIRHVSMYRATDAE